jgi:hypothetical protein
MLKEAVIVCICGDIEALRGLGEALFPGIAQGDEFHTQVRAGSTRKALSTAYTDDTDTYLVHCFPT